MEDFFNSGSKIGIKSLSFSTIDKKLSVSVKDCLSVELKSKIQSENKDFIIVYKNTEYQCDREIIKYFIKSISNNRLELNLNTGSDNENDDDNGKNKIDSKDKNQSTSNDNVYSNSEEKSNDSSKADMNESDTKVESKNRNSDENISTNEINDSSSNNIKNESESEISHENLSDEEYFVRFVFLKFFNGDPVIINEENINLLKFISNEDNLNIPSFLKICTIFDKFYEIYDKLDPIADIQYDIINIDELIGIRNTQSEISQAPSIDLLEQDFEQDEASITAISSFGSVFFSDSISPSYSQEFFEKIVEVIEDITDRIANDPELSNNIILIYNILIKACIYRPENIQFYIKIIKQLDEPKPQGKGIKIIDTIRKLYLHNINQSTDFFVLHEMMLGGIFTVKEVLDVVKESTSLEFKIWFAPYIEEAEADRKKQNNNNDNDNDNLEDDAGYGNVIQDIEDRIYSISEPEKREFKVHFFNAIRENNWELHKILSRQGANHTPIARAIRRDDVKKLQKILAFDPKSSVNDVIQWSAFEHIQYLLNSPTLIQYAAFYGAVKCFKFLMLNQAKLDKMDDNKQFLINYAVAGGNTEIVRICIQQKVPTFSVLSPACLFYRFDLLDWILENVFPTIANNFKQTALQNALLNSLESFNFSSILKLSQFIDVNSLYKSAAVDNELILDILNLFRFNREEKVYMLLCSTESHNFEFFKQIFSTLKIKLKDDTNKEVNDDSALEAFDDEEIAEDDNIGNNHNDGNENNNDNENENNENQQNQQNQANNANPNQNILDFITDHFQVDANDFIGENGDVDIDRVVRFLQEHTQNDDDDEDGVNLDDADPIPLNIPLINRADLNNGNDENQNDDDNDNDNDDDDDKYFTMDDSDVLTLIIQAISNDNDRLMEFINNKIYRINLFKHIYISDTVQYDVIQLSVIYGAIRCLKYITSRPDFKVSLCNKDDYSILRLAILFNQSEVLKFLLSFKGLNINSTEKEGGSAFTAATWDNQIPLVKILYKHGGVDINMKGKLGETPLTGTVLQKTPKMMELLLSYPEINVYEVNKENKTAMMLCLEHSTVDCFFTLIQCSKFDINSPKSCFDCSTAKFCLLSKFVSSDMIKIVMDVPNINLNEVFNGETIGNQLQKKLLEMKDDDDDENDDNDEKNKDDGKK